MSFDTEKVKPSSKKIFLVEIDFPLDNDVFINFEAGIWFNTLTPGDVSVIGSDGEIGYYPNDNSQNYFRVGSVLVDDIALTKVFSLADLRIQDKSFYYDQDTTKIYFHFEDWHHPLDKNVVLGIVTGYCDKVDTVRSEGAFYNNIFYEPVVKSIPSLNKTKDKTFFGLLQFQSGSVSLINTDGRFDSFVNDNLFGQAIRVFMGFENLEFDDYRKVYEGFIEDYNITFDIFTVGIQDKRKKLSRSIPTRKYSIIDYPDLNPDNNDANKPVAYGVIRNAPVIVLNEYGTEPFVCHFMDTTDHVATALTTVYTDGAVVTPSNVDLTAGTFELSDVQAYDAGGALKEITCDFTGAYGVSNGLDVLKDLLLLYDSKAFIASNFNLTEWAAETILASDIGLYVNDDTELNKIIADISVSLNGIFFFQDDGLMTFRSYDENRTPAAIVRKYEWFNEPNIDYPSDEFLTSVKTKYSKNQLQGKYRQVVNTDFESEVVKISKKYKQRTIETLLTSSADADNHALAIINRSKEIQPHIKRKINLQYIDLEIMDFIIAEKDRLDVSDEDRQYAIYEIIGINKGLTNNSISLELVFVRNTTDDDFIIFYQQGILWFTFLLGDKIYGSTRY